jgi:hypothetical protein
MAFRHGKGAAFKLDNSSGSLVDLSAYIDEVGFPQSVETGETTTFGKTAKTYIVGLTDSTLSVNGKWDSTLDAHVAAVIAAQSAGTVASVSFEYGPEGTASGRIKYSGEALVTSFEVSSPVADVVTFSLELQVTDSVTRGTWA